MLILTTAFLRTKAQQPLRAERQRHCQRRQVQAAYMETTLLIRSLFFIRTLSRAAVISLVANGKREGRVLNPSVPEAGRQGEKKRKRNGEKEREKATGKG